MANFYTNTQNPAQKAMDNVSGKNTYNLPKAQKFNKVFSNPILGGKNLFGEFGGANQDVQKPPVQPATQPVPQQNQNTSSGNFNPFPQAQPQAPQGPQRGTPGYYADQIEGYRDQYAPRVAAPYGQFGIGEGQKRLSDYELTRMNSLINPTQKLLEASAPQAVAPGSSVIQPIAGGQFPGYSPEESAFRGGQIGQIGTQGAQSVQYNQAQKTITGIKNLLGNDNATSINRINNFVNQIKQNVSSPELASFRTTLGALAQQVSPFNESLAKQLNNYAGDGLANASGSAIMSAINQAQQAIQSQQQAVSGGISGQSAPSSSGGFVNTAVGPVPTNW